MRMGQGFVYGQSKSDHPHRPYRHPVTASSYTRPAAPAKPAAPAQSGWTWQNPLPQGNDLAGIIARLDYIDGIITTVPFSGCCK